MREKRTNIIYTFELKGEKGTERKNVRGEMDGKGKMKDYEREVK